MLNSFQHLREATYSETMKQVQGDTKRFGQPPLHWWPCADDRYRLLAGFRPLRLTDILSGYEGQAGGPFYD